MELTLPQWGQLLTLFMVSVALGMDAFSLGIGIGMRGLMLFEGLKISLIIGFFHVVMPLLGLLTGRYLGALVENIAVITGGVLLCILGAQMVWHACDSEKEEVAFHSSTGWGVLMFSLSVSLDSLSAGFSLGLFEVDILLAVLLFGFVGGLMAFMGLLLGRNVGPWIGDYGEAVGGIILISLGLRFLL
ncbi:manganese efflux pump MntP family protein [Melghirimyces algeriensis]|uniref:Putative manganese efflux pump MntP n=1 Tax=Melghirimyces algeriensis TaxID=910412 RepID=A0A521D913_9BACL|nr:manganese efflux pump [Melghirimyces algeriensis]SMO67380.1 Putative Mn2+ efflux pump MntP [Melghirimyces algeriensis]